MRKYDLYIIESSFIDYYYGKERVIFNLFKDYEEAKGSLKKVLARQIEYITEPIPILKIHNQLEKKLQERHEFFIKDGVFYLQESKGHARLILDNKKCMIYSKGRIDVEMIFMEALRKTDFNFFAVDIKNTRYGWIKPMKEKHYI